MNVKKSVKQLLRSRSAGIFGGPVPIFKYLPEAYGSSSYVIPMRPRYDNVGVDNGLNVPPLEFWLGYGDDLGDKAMEWYLSKGKRDIDKMHEIVTADRPLAPDARILEMGCAAGRMIRHLKPLVGTAEIWGVDVSAPLINWCKMNLSPPFNFATTTSIPHLPFADGYFDLIYTGSVFTHIDDLADAWLLELRRILAPGGRAYLTIHDRHTIKLIEDGYYYDKTGYFTDPDRKEVYLPSVLNASPSYIKERDTFGVLVIGRDNASNVFYDIDFFRKMVTPMYSVVSVNEEAYGHQTAVLLERR
jgi:SAM-dependent methyltransferase